MPPVPRREVPERALPARIRRMEYDIGRLKRRVAGATDPVPPITLLEPKLYNDSNGAFSTFSDNPFHYYIDRGRCYLGGLLHWVGSSTGYTGTGVFQSITDGLPAAAAPVNGLATIHVPVETTYGSVYGYTHQGSGDPAPYSINLYGAVAEAQILLASLSRPYIFFEQMVAPRPVNPSGSGVGGDVAGPAGYGTPLRESGVIDGSILCFDNVSWRVA